MCAITILLLNQTTHAIPEKPIEIIPECFLVSSKRIGQNIKIWRKIEYRKRPTNPLEALLEPTPRQDRRGVPVAFP